MDPILRGSLAENFTLISSNEPTTQRVENLLHATDFISEPTTQKVETVVHSIIVDPLITFQISPREEIILLNFTETILNSDLKKYIDFPIKDCLSFFLRTAKKNSEFPFIQTYLTLPENQEKSLLDLLLEMIKKDPSLSSVLSYFDRINTLSIHGSFTTIFDFFIRLITSPDILESTEPSILKNLLKSTFFLEESCKSSKCFDVVPLIKLIKPLNIKMRVEIITWTTQFSTLWKVNTDSLLSKKTDILRNFITFYFSSFVKPKQLPSKLIPLKTKKIVIESFESLIFTEDLPNFSDNLMKFTEFSEQINQEQSKIITNEVSTNIVKKNKSKATLTKEEGLHLVKQELTRCDATTKLITDTLKNLSINARAAFSITDKIVAAINEHLSLSKKLPNYLTNIEKLKPLFIAIINRLDSLKENSRTAKDQIPSLVSSINSLVVYFSYFEFVLLPYYQSDAVHDLCFLQNFYETVEIDDLVNYIDPKAAIVLPKLSIITVDQEEEFTTTPPTSKVEEVDPQTPTKPISTESVFVEMSKQLTSSTNTKQILSIIEAAYTTLNMGQTDEIHTHLLFTLQQFFLLQNDFQNIPCYLPTLFIDGLLAIEQKLKKHHKDPDILTHTFNTFLDGSSLQLDSSIIEYLRNHNQGVLIGRYPHTYPGSLIADSLLTITPLCDKIRNTKQFIKNLITVVFALPNEIQKPPGLKEFVVAIKKVIDKLSFNSLPTTITTPPSSAYSQSHLLLETLLQKTSKVPFLQKKAQDVLVYFQTLQGASRFKQAHCDSSYQFLYLRNLLVIAKFYEQCFHLLFLMTEISHVEKDQLYNLHDLIWLFNTLNLTETLGEELKTDLSQINLMKSFYYFSDRPKGKNAKYATPLWNDFHKMADFAKTQIFLQANPDFTPVGAQLTPPEITQYEAIHERLLKAVPILLQHILKQK